MCAKLLPDALSQDVPRMAGYTIEELFNLLDRGRHLPKYKLELRASPFFELFLPELLREYCMPVKVPIIPEFPLKKDNNNQSKNVDFFALSKDNKRAFLIELKTDMSSLSRQQDDYLKTAAGKSLVDLIKDIKQIGSSSTNYRKYVHLLKQLEELRLVGSTSEAVDKAFKDNPRGVRKAILNVEVKAPKCFPNIVYIQPSKRNGTSEDCITFEQVSTVVAKHHPIGKVFAEHLAEWQKSPAEHAP